jgi:cytochrome c biogenesis protein CcmG, thiol:disulfide interchange protein DsbE
MAQRSRIVAPVPLAVIAVALALVALLAYGLVSRGADTSIDSKLAKGEHPEAPSTTLPVLFGSGNSSLEAYRGKVVLLNYWASWCVPCRQEAPLLQRWQPVMQSKGGTVLGVDVNDISDNGQSFARKFKLTYPLLRDGNAHSQAAYGVLAYPESFLVDRQGHIRAAARGPVDEQFMRTKVLALLEEPS